MLLGGLIGLNFFLIYSEASGAVPFSTMLAIVCLWGIISLPLSVVGSYIGLRKTKLSQPVRTNQIPRQVPDQPILQSFVPSIMMGGILPFAAIFIELYFIMNSIWFHRIYYGIGFLFLVFGVLLVTCSQVAVLMCYFHLCNEDYHWSWRSFMTSGATGFYVYLYSFIYYFTRLNINSFASTVLYFGYSSMLSILLAIMTGKGWMNWLFVSAEQVIDFYFYFFRGNWLPFLSLLFT
jgi:transmembrane 9 superfamily protein 2/4